MRINRDGKKALITNGKYDVMDISTIDETGGYVYFRIARQCYSEIPVRTRLDGTGQLEMVSPANQKGTYLPASLMANTHNIVFELYHR
jgi:dipeptidyl-peptidase-4